VLEVTLSRPRERLALAHDARFMDLRAAVLEFLYEKQVDKKTRKAELRVA
jgi:nitrate/nitrite transport system ATP-binding protein